MSDALTDIARDERRARVLRKIVELEGKGDLTTAEIEELIRLWEEYKSIGRGYWTVSDQKLADRKIKEYANLLLK